MPRVSLDGALSHEVCVFNLPTLPKVWPFMVQCLFMHCSTRGWPLRKRCAQRLCKGLPTNKTYCHVLCVILCHVCIFFLSNKQFSSSSSSSSSSSVSRSPVNPVILTFELRPWKVSYIIIIEIFFGHVRPRIIMIFTFIPEILALEFLWELPSPKH